MAYRLIISEYAYSDGSLRGWLELDAFGLECRPRYVPMQSDQYVEALTKHAPAQSLPVLLTETNEEALVWDSAVAAETLAERHPDAGHWPQCPDARATARALAVRGRTGYPALRTLPMNLHERYVGFVAGPAEQEDSDAVCELWEWALARSGGPYLCGQKFCAADAAFAPIVTRFVTYGLKATEAARAYVEAIFAHPSFRRWHACADAQMRRIDELHHDLPSGDTKEWPRQPVLPARPYRGDVADAMNDMCPYSGLPVAADSLAEINGQIVGFCNPFCCRRGMADAQSWPTVMSVLQRQADLSVPTA